VALQTTSIKKAKFKIIKIRIACQYIQDILLQRKPKLGALAAGWTCGWFR